MRILQIQMIFLNTLKNKPKARTMGVKIKKRMAKFARKTMKLITKDPMFGSVTMMTRGTPSRKSSIHYEDMAEKGRAYESMDGTRTV